MVKDFAYQATMKNKENKKLFYPRTLSVTNTTTTKDIGTLKRATTQGVRFDRLLS